MAGPSSISSAASHDSKANNLKTLFARGLDFQTADHDLINNYIVHRVNQYAARNLEDWSLWDSIQMDFAEFEAKHFDELDNDTWGVIRDYCYPHGFWIDHNFGPGRNRTTTILKAVEADWNNKWTLEQIKWVEERYNSLSRITCKRKQQLIGITNFDSPGNPEPHTANSRGFLVEPQTQQFQDIRLQTPPQQPTLQPLYPALSKPSEQQHSAYSHQSTHAYQRTHGPQYAYKSQHTYENQFRPTYEQQQPAYQYTYECQPTYGHQYAYAPQFAYENQYGPNEYQPVPNDYPLVPNGLTFEIRDDRECIPERLTAPTTQVFSIQAAPTQTPPTQLFPIQAPPAQILSAQVPPAQISLVPASPIQALQIQAPPVQVLPSQAPPVHELSALPPSAPNEPGYGQPKKHPEQVNPERHGTVHLSENPIEAYKSGLVNHVYTYVVNHEAVYKPMQQNYRNKNEDGDLYLTDCQYRRGRFKRQDLRYHRRKRLKEMEMVKQKTWKYH